MEAQDIIDTESLELEDDGTEVAPLHLWYGGGLELVEGVL